MKALQPLLEIADLHANRILIAIEHIQKNIPVSANKIYHLTDEELSF